MEVKQFLQYVDKLGIDFFTGVPDSLLAPLCDTLYLQYGSQGQRHVVAANEGNAVGLAAGHYIGSGRPAMVYMQNSGIGNAVNPIASLLHKVLCAVLSMVGGGPRDYETLCRIIEEKAYTGTERNMDLIAVPTTAGTGADVTQWATVWDMRDKRKLSVDRPDLAPDLSLVIPAFTVDMPPSLTLSTGLDALAQGMESFWAKARNPLSQSLALEAVAYIRKYLPLALKEPEDLTYRGGMCMGALLSGLAFSKTRTTASHSISYPLTIYHGVPHGFAVAVTLEQVAERNGQAVPEIETLFGLFGGREEFHQWLTETSEDIQPLRLSAMGIREQDLPKLAEEAFTQGRMDNNPVPLRKEDVCSILKEVL